MIYGTLYRVDEVKDLEETIKTLVLSFIKKVNVVPDTVEMNPEQQGELREVMVCCLDGDIGASFPVSVIPSKRVLNNHFLIGLEEAVDISYLSSEERDGED